jgi:[NiFe] hydrogenase diaphorase moiety large subunit
VYEVDFGMTLGRCSRWRRRDAQAVQVGGPSGQLVGPDEYDRTICFDDLATGGSIMVFGPQRNVLEVATRSWSSSSRRAAATARRAASATCCSRSGWRRSSRARRAGDLEYLEELGETIKATSRCGLGQTSPNPVLTTLKNFRPLYEAGQGASGRVQAVVRSERGGGDGRADRRSQVGHA